MGGVQLGFPLSTLLYISAAVKYLQFPLMPAQGVQIGDHEMKILNFPTRIQSILKSHEKASISKTNFSKVQTLLPGA